MPPVNVSPKRAWGMVHMNLHAHPLSLAGNNSAPWTRYDELVLLSILMSSTQTLGRGMMSWSCCLFLCRLLVLPCDFSG